MEEFHVTCRVSIQVDLPFFFELDGIGIEPLQDDLHILEVKTIVSSEATWPKCQVTVAKHMEMSPEDIAAALAYGCRKLVDEEWEMGWSCEHLVKL